MKIISWNVNGYRSVLNKNKIEQLFLLNPDYICFQEIKMNEELIDIPGFNVCYNFATRRNGYSGVAVLSKEVPLKIETKIGDELFDSEGRYLEVHFKDFILINLYVVNGGRDLSDLDYKLRTLDIIIKRLKNLNDKNVIICTDFNVAHKEIDVKNYKNNYNKHMFTIPERKTIDKLLDSGYVDVFREHNLEDGIYSWWSYMFNAREKNVGWRLDYFFMSKKFYKNNFRASYLMDYLGSDHCPLLLENING